MNEHPLELPIAQKELYRLSQRSGWSYLLHLIASIPQKYAAEHQPVKPEETVQFETWARASATVSEILNLLEEQVSAGEMLARAEEEGEPHHAKESRSGDSRERA